MDKTEKVAMYCPANAYQTSPAWPCSRKFANSSAYAESQ